MPSLGRRYYFCAERIWNFGIYIKNLAMRGKSWETLQNKSKTKTLTLFADRHKMDISRSGRIRKKSSKLADFESPDEIDAVTQIKKPTKVVS